MALGTAVSITGDDFTIDGNSVVACQSALAVTGSATVSGAASITNLKASTCGQALVLIGNSVAVEKMQALDCGRNATAGAAVLVRGNANNLTGVKVTNSGGDGFGIDGDDNLLQACTADACAKNAFDVEDTNATPNTPDSNLLDACKGTNCGGQGLDNNGTLTSVTNCTFTGNLLDVGKSGGATYGTFSGNTIGDGSDATTAEVVD
ncbi:MAG: hypothetical protein L6R28_19690 [Planctomycetes bacterium]|nr:hypothetical protein [Planctomycetota bacterium]